MRTKLRLVKGLGDQPPFTVPGQRFEPLPPGTFAGLGASLQTVWHEPFHKDYATGGSTSQFAGRNQRMGNTVAGMGFSLSDVVASLEAGAASAAGSFLQSQSAAPIVQAAQTQAVQSAGASSFAWAQTHWKQIAIGAAVLGAILIGGGYYLAKKR